MHILCKYVRVGVSVARNFSSVSVSGASAKNVKVEVQLTSECQQCRNHGHSTLLK